MIEKVTCLYKHTDNSIFSSTDICRHLLAVLDFWSSSG